MQEIQIPQRDFKTIKFLFRSINFNISIIHILQNAYKLHLLVDVQLVSHQRHITLTLLKLFTCFKCNSKDRRNFFYSFEIKRAQNMNNWYYCRYFQNFNRLPIKRNIYVSLKLREKIILKSSKYRNNKKSPSKNKITQRLPFFLSFGILSIVADSSFL